MGKKQKNPKHAEAIRRKEAASLEMAKIGLKLESERSIVGFMFNHLSTSHMTYFGLNSINNLCKKYAGLDICIFRQHIMPPCVPVLCPLFGIAELLRWDRYPLIATSMETAIHALSTNADIVYHYVFDPEFIDVPNKDTDQIRPAFCDARIRVISRHDDHRRLIAAEFGIDVHTTIVPDFDAEMLARIALTENQNV